MKAIEKCFLCLTHLTRSKINLKFVDCSQSPIFSYDCQDRVLIGTGGHLDFLCTDGAGI